MLGQLRSVAQHEPGHGARQLAGEFGAAASREKIDDRQIVVTPPSRHECLCPILGDFHPVALLPQDQRQGLRVAGIILDEQDRSSGSHDIQDACKQPAYQLQFVQNQ